MFGMFRTSDIVMISAMVAAAAFTYVTKHGAEAELREIGRLQAAIRFEEETITLLQADWSLLTQPSRIQQLAEAYHEQLQLVPVESHQFGRLQELPPRPLRIEDVLEEAAGAGVAGAEIDNLLTGAVTP